MAEWRQMVSDPNPTSPSQTQTNLAITQSSLPQTGGADDGRRQLPEQLQSQQEEQEIQTGLEDKAGAVSHAEIHKSHRRF